MSYLKLFVKAVRIQRLIFYICKTKLNFYWNRGENPLKSNLSSSYSPEFTNSVILRKLIFLSFISLHTADRTANSALLKLLIFTKICIDTWYIMLLNAVFLRYYRTNLRWKFLNAIGKRRVFFLFRYCWEWTILKLHTPLKEILMLITMAFI